MSGPNILLFMPDQLRGDWAGIGNRGGVRTPAIDALMRRGVAFRRAICPSPICGPSRACMANGYEYDRAGVGQNGKSMSLARPNYYRRLRDRGYQVLTCGKVDLLKGEPDWGVDGQHGAGAASRLKAVGFTGGLDSGGKHACFFALRDGHDEPYGAFLKARGLADQHSADFSARKNLALGTDALAFPGAGPNYLNTAATVLPDDAYADNWIGRSGLQVLEDAAQSDKPWFLQVNLAGPHEPMDITQSMAHRVGDRTPPPPSVLGELALETHLKIRRNYAAMIENVDAIFAQYMDFLQRSGQLDNTIVIFTSDHGEMLGDCARWEKFVPYQPSLHVPLIFAGPGIVENRVVDAPATVLDIHATVLDFAGAALIAETDSRSMRAVLTGAGAAPRDVVFSGLGQWRVAYDGRYKLVAGFDPAVPRKVMEAGPFDIDNRSRWLIVEPDADPLESHDLSDALPAVTQRLTQALIDNTLRPLPREAEQADALQPVS